jgi:hypothetical protein
MRAVFKYIFLISIFCGLALLPAKAESVQITITWDPINHPSLSRYEVLWGSNSKSYNSSLTVGKSNQANINVESGKNYFFAVRGVDTQEHPGELSAEVSRYISTGQMQVSLKAEPSLDAIFLPRLRENDQFRTNLGINNPSDQTANINLALVDQEGIVRSVSFKVTDSADGKSKVISSLQVPPHGMRQLNQIVGIFENEISGTSFKEGNLILESTQPVLAWASEIDNLSSDPSMMISRNTGATRIWIPSVANTGAWCSSLVLENLGGSDSPVSIKAFSPDGALLDSSLGELIVPSMGNLSFDNILDYMKIPYGYGPIEIVSLNDQPLAATSRVYNPKGAGGFFEAVPSDLASPLQYIPHLIENTAVRTNLGINNWSGQVANVALRFFDKSGRELLPSPWKEEVLPNGLKQINSDIIAQKIKQFTNGKDVECSVRIESDQPVLGWVSQIENNIADPSDPGDPGFSISHNQGGHHLLVPSSANSNTWSSSLVVVNPNDEGTLIDIVARDIDGKIIGQLTGIGISPRGFFQSDNILASLGIFGNFGPIEIITNENTPLLVTSRIRSVNKTSGFFEGQILE